MTCSEALHTMPNNLQWIGMCHVSGKLTAKYFLQDNRGNNFQAGRSRAAIDGLEQISERFRI